MIHNNKFLDPGPKESTGSGGPAEDHSEDSNPDAEPTDFTEDPDEELPGEDDLDDEDESDDYEETDDPTDTL